MPRIVPRTTGLGMLLPTGAVAAEAVQGDCAAEIFPEEQALVAGAVDGRRREFTAGRVCARAALRAMGVPP